MTINLPKILLVDDIEVNLILLETALRKEQAQMYKATSGAEALKITETTEFALIILDVSMPGMNGFELAERIRKQDLNTVTPIIFISAIHFDEFSVSQGYRSGAVDYISKPYHHEILLSKVRVFLQLYNQKQELFEQSKFLQESNNRYKAIQETLKLRLEHQKAVSLASARFSGNFDLINSIHFMLRDIANACGATSGLFISSGNIQPIIYDENQLNKPHLEEQIYFKPNISKKELTTLKLILKNEFERHNESVVMLGKERLSDKLKMPFLHDQANIQKNETNPAVSINVTSGDKHYGYIVILNCAGIIGWEAFELKALSVFGTITGNALEREDTRQNLVDSELRYRSYIENAPEGIVVTTSKGAILEYNKAFIRMFPDFVVRKGTLNIHNLLNKQDLSGHNPVNHTLLNGRISKAEFSIKNSDKNMLVKAESVRLSAQKYLIFCTDITKERELEKHLIQTERMVAIGEMATGIAHEINQPLNTISFGIDNLFQALNAGKADSAYIKEKSRKIFEGIHRMRNIIDHVRNFARGNDDVLLASFCVTEPVENALSFYTEQFKNHGINVVKNIESAANAVIHGNTFKMEQVILNLLSNSRDSILDKINSSGHDYQPEVRIGITLKDSTVKIDVADNGLGIDREQLKDVIKPFVTGKAPGKGTGLGLAISQKIVNEHNGTLSIDSVKGEGTTVSILLPVNLKHNPPSNLPLSNQTSSNE
jgi:PAS domain S-box-containing protein